MESEDTKETSLSENLSNSGLSVEEEFVLDVHRLLDEHPLFKDGELPKPAMDYLVHFLARQPELRKFTHIERREHLLNIFFLGYIRDLLGVSMAKAKEKHGDKWLDHFDIKYMRMIRDAITRQEKILPDIFKATGEEFTERDVSKKIVKRMTEEIIEFNPKAKGVGETVEGEYKVMEE